LEQMTIEFEAPMSLVLPTGQEWFSYTSVSPYILMEWCITI
jgi:hypothetical protein